MSDQLRAIVLAAGKGTRLQTDGCDLPKVMRPACGRPLLWYVLDALSFIPKDDIAIVVGYKKDDVMSHFPDYHFAVQAEQLGTGHAVLAARQYIDGFDGSVLVCCGDMPLIQKSTYESLAREHFANSFDCTILSGPSDIPLPYGRIIRAQDGSFLRMVEDRDCSDDEKKVTELNSGVYVFRARALLSALSGLHNHNAQREYYLTDVPAILQNAGARVGICQRDLGSEIIGVNKVEQLEQVERIIQNSDRRHTFTDERYFL